MRRDLIFGKNIVAPKTKIQTILEGVDNASFFTMPLSVIDLAVFSTNEEVVKTARWERHARDGNLGL